MSQSAEHDDVGASDVVYFLGNVRRRDLDNDDIIAVLAVRACQRAVDQQQSAGTNFVLKFIYGGLVESVEHVKRVAVRTGYFLVAYFDAAVGSAAAHLCAVGRVPGNVLTLLHTGVRQYHTGNQNALTAKALLDSKNLLILKAFTKLYGMAGARMGYLMSNNEIIEYLQRDSTGFCCSRMGLHAAEAALDDVEFQEMTKKGNKEGREILVSCMKELGFRVWPSHTNFIYFDPGVDVKWFADRLLDYGIIIRGNFNANRISIGTPEEDRFVCKAMREIMAEAKK